MSLPSSGQGCSAVGSDKENINMTDNLVKETTESSGGVKRKKKARGGSSRKKSRVASRGKAATRRARVGLGDEIVESPCQAPEGVGREEGEPSKPPAAPPTYVPTQSIHGSPAGDGDEDCRHESDSVDANTRISDFGSPRRQSHEDGSATDVVVEVNREVGETEQEYVVEDEPYLAEDTFLESRYRILKILGHGNFSTTYLAEEAPTEPEPPDMPPKTVAIKRMKQQYALIGENESLLLGFLHEGEKPRHIISPIASFISETNHFHLVLEPLDSARPISLSKCGCISRSAHSNLACPHRHLSLAKILVQLLSGLLSLHSHHLIHADLTPANVLFLPSSNRIKLIDLGNAIQPDDREAYLDDFSVQSACYRAPEILLGSGPLSRVMDVWSAGVIAVELLLDDGMIGEGLEGAELMRSCVDGREAMVLRTVELVGSVREYTGGMYYADMYDEISLEPVVFMSENGKPEGPRAEKKGILRDLLEDATGNLGLVDFLMNMMEVGVRRRKTVNEMLRHPWLIRQLLGNWGDILMGGIEDDRTVGGDVQHQLELEVLEEGAGVDDVQRSEEVEGVLFFDEQQGKGDLDQFLEVGHHEHIRNQSTNRQELDLQSSSPHISLWEDVSVSLPPERGLQFDGVKREPSAERFQLESLPPPIERPPSCHSPPFQFGEVESGLELGILPLPTEMSPPSPCHSPWQYVYPPGRQLQPDEVKRECSSCLTVLRLGSENEVDYLNNLAHTDNSVPEASLVTSGGTTSIGIEENMIFSLLSSPLATLPLLQEGTASIRTPELCSPSPVAFVGKVEQVEQVERVEQVEQAERMGSLLLYDSDEEAMEASGVWDRDLAADMDDMSEGEDDDQVMLC